MSNEFSDRLRELRKDAFSEAESTLRKLGFILGEADHWRGEIDCQEYGLVRVSVELPSEFPDTLPNIRIDRTTLPRRVPHVEKSGKICLADSTGLLLDADNPQGIITDSLRRAQSILMDGLSGRNEDHLIQEFLAYWNEEAAATLWSVCAPDGAARVIREVRLLYRGDPSQERILLADSLEVAEKWASKIDWETGNSMGAFFIPLRQSFIPPDFEEVLSVSQVVEMLRTSASQETWRIFQQRLSAPQLPVTVLLALPLPRKQEQALCGVVLPIATGEAGRDAAKGFRPRRVPASRQLAFNNKAPVMKLKVERFDPEYLLVRGGAVPPLFSKTVVVVGCGAVGSRVVQHLAAMGVGHLRLIDPDSLQPENVHRHVLGVGYVGVSKTVGLKTWLEMNFPHIEIEHREKGVEAVLQEEPEFITESSLVVIAVGDETLELRLNSLLRDRLPRVHVWVEPLGLGGHVLSAGVSGGVGCFRCLFEMNSEYGLFNQASFAAPGQRFQRSFAGCAGSFTPFANADADQAALEAVRLVSGILLGKERDNILISWRGDRNDFTEMGFQLSSRGKMAREGERRRETSFYKIQCPDCQVHPQ